MIENRNLRSICHASVGVSDLSVAKAFYLPLLAKLDIQLVCEYEHALAFGKGYPEFWLQYPFDKKTATAGNGVHFGFVASSKKQVDDFYQCAIAHGGIDNGQPGKRPGYGEPFYGCFVIDPFGNKIEACYWQVADQ